MGFNNQSTSGSALLCLLILLINHLQICKASDHVLCIPSEQQALLNFKYHLLDPSNRLASWSGNTNCCHWISVVCNNAGHILELHLKASTPSSYWENDAYERSRFGGEIHASIGDLKQLSYLDLSYNYFGGIQIPSFLGSIKSLTYLNLSHAGFSGSIPYQIGNLSSLLYLDLGGNLFIGNIPHQIGNISNLLYLDLSAGGYIYDLDDMPLMSVENLQWLSSLSSLKYLELSFVNMSVTFDWLHVLQSLPSLTELHLHSCALHRHFHPLITVNFSSLSVLDLSYTFDFGASIPKWIFQLKKLVSLQLRGNNLQGFIPNGFQNLTLIEELDLFDNLFNSTIPDWLYSLNHLKSLSLSSNQLHGTISNAIGNLTSMVILDLSYNQLQGPIPSSLRDLCHLRSVHFSGTKCNQQVSEIIETLSGCPSHTLQSLYISNSKLYGHLTPQIGIFRNLLSLALYGNSIQGAIPLSLGNLTSLNFLDLSENQFDRNPFDTLQSLSELRSLYTDGNLFHGVVNEDQLVNFTKLKVFSASGYKLNLNVGSNWNPSFQKLELLYISSMHLGPHFPSWIKSLKYLRTLFIPNCNISDSIPTWVWDAFPQASNFNFSNNDIHGDLSSTLKNPINVSNVDLSSNHLSGHLPHISPNVVYLDLSSNWFSGSIASFTCEEKEDPMGLVYLNLASNNLSGQIPDCWTMWPNLTIVKFDNNYFRGNLPISIGSLPWLNSLQLCNNTLVGSFPLCLKNSTKLVFLDFRENQFSGIIPLWVGRNLLNLKVLLLRSNKFIGKIPSQICSLNSLQILDLAQNNLSGEIPKCFNNLTVMLVKNSSLESNIRSHGNHTVSYSITNVLLKLKGRDDEYSFLSLITSIDLSHNKLSGKIPREITSLMGLYFLNLSNNLLHGEIPQNIGNMGSLESIDFSKNQLYGEIPSSMSNLNFLAKLNFSYNNLIGKIPTGTQLQSFEASSFLGNHLCGPLLPNNCVDVHDVPDHDHNDKEANRGGINWFFVSTSLGFVFGFWVVVGPLLYNRSWRYTYFQFLDCMWYKLQSCWS